MKNTKCCIIPSSNDNGKLNYDQIYHSNVCPLILDAPENHQSSSCTNCVRIFTNLQRSKKAYAARKENVPLLKLTPSASRHRLHSTILQQKLQ